MVRIARYLREATNNYVVGIAAPHGEYRMPVMEGVMSYKDLPEDSFYPGREAVDVYGHYNEDIALFAEMGLKCCRFSVFLVPYFSNGGGGRTQRGRASLLRCVYRRAVEI